MNNKRKDFEEKLKEVYPDGRLVFTYCDEPQEAGGQFYYDGRVDMAWKLYQEMLNENH